MNRRAFLAFTALVPVAACTGTALTPAQIVSDAAAVVNGIKGALPELTSLFPALIPASALATINTDLADAATVVTGLSANLPAQTGATAVQQIVGYVNAVINTLAAPPVSAVIPPPYNAVFASAAVLLPTLEAFVASVITAAGASPITDFARTAVLAQGPSLSLAAARAILAQYAAR